MKVYVALMQGVGDSEDEFYNIGVYSTEALAQEALDLLEAETEMDSETRIEEYTVDA